MGFEIVRGQHGKVVGDLHHAHGPGPRSAPDLCVIPGDLSKEHAALVRAAMDGKLGRRQLMVRGMALGLSATAVAGLLSAYRAPAAVAQSPVAAEDNPLAGQTID